MATGRTASKYMKFQIEDSGGTLRDIPVGSFGDIGITYDEVDVSSLQEAVKGMLSGQGNFSVTITGPFDNTAAATASASGEASEDHMSGSHTVLSALNGGNTPRAFGVYIGVQADWSTGDPVFGADNCVIVTDYKCNDGVNYSATISHVSGGTAPSWGTTAIAVA